MREREEQGKERREENCSPHPLPQIKKKFHNREIYVASIMEECGPQMDGSAEANVLLVFLRDLF